MIAFAAAHASAQLRIVSYNMLDKPASLADTATIGYVNSVFGAIAASSSNGIAKRPDIIFASEQTTSSPANLATILNTLYGVTSYTSVIPNAPQSQGTSDLIAFVYDSSAVTLSSAPTALAIQSSYPRPTIRAGFRPVGYSDAAADVYVYGMHLKASTTATDIAERANQTLATRANSNALPTGSNIVYAGDFNVYTSDEPGYRNLFAAGNGQAADPINASYLANGDPILWNSSTYAAIHTQSTRLTTLPDRGATGGVDDRFDYQLISNGMLDGDGISYVGPSSPGSGSTHSYTAFGNNGSTYNRAINYTGNTAQPANVLNAIYNLSDHLPVVADYQLPAKMSIATTVPPSAVIMGANVTINVAVTNSAAVAAPLGADALDYSVSATNILGGVQTGSVRATLGASIQTLSVDTTTPGAKVVQVSVNSSNQAVAGGAFTQNLPITVYSPAQPSLSDSSTLTQASVDLGIVAIGTTIGGTFDVFNLNAAGFTAGLDLDSATLSGSASFGSGFVPQANINAGGSASVGFTFSATQSQSDSAVLTILTSDVNLPGAHSRSPLTLNLVARGAIAGDANLSGMVNFDDLLILAQNYLTTNSGWLMGDFNRDLAVDFDDLLALAQNYQSNGLGSSASSFANDWALARSVAPEPTALATSSLIAIGMRRRRCV